MIRGCSGFASSGATTTARLIPKFGRVFVEEYRDQLSRDWGAPRVPDCSGVSVEDMANVDVDKMDFSEVYGDVAKDVTLPVSGGIKTFFDQRFPKSKKDATQTYSGGTP